MIQTFQTPNESSNIYTLSYERDTNSWLQTPMNPHSTAKEFGALATCTHELCSCFSITIFKDRICDVSKIL